MVILIFIVLYRYPSPGIPLWYPDIQHQIITSTPVERTSSVGSSFTIQFYNYCVLSKSLYKAHVLRWLVCITRSSSVVSYWGGPLTGTWFSESSFRDLDLLSWCPPSIMVLFENDLFGGSCVIAYTPLGTYTYRQLHRNIRCVIVRSP